jgi:ATP-dependent Clp protease adaptor protein ClpS
MDAATEVRPGTDERTMLAPLHRVIIHNDDVTPMDFVVDVLTRIFGLESRRAVEVMWEAHHSGCAHVITEPLERAEFHVDQAKSLARGRGFPLTFSIEPEPQ